MVDNAEWLGDISAFVWMMTHSPWVLLVVFGVLFLDYILETNPLISVVAVLVCGIFSGLHDGQWGILLIIGLLLGWGVLTLAVNYILISIFKIEIDFGCLWSLVLFTLIPISLFVKGVVVYWEWWQISILVGAVLIGLIVLWLIRKNVKEE